ncbi:hypothetical protein CGCSCA1_v004429 [Colletotrichum siamense]|nr:hypothetical protein CGCSCA1_v004429 [Colletotrichum siamense]
MQDIPVIDYRTRTCRRRSARTALKAWSGPAAPALVRRNRYLQEPKWRLARYNVHKPAEFFALCNERYRELSWIGLEMSVIRNMNWKYESEPGSDSDPEDDFSHNKTDGQEDEEGGLTWQRRGARLGSEKV